MTVLPRAATRADFARCLVLIAQADLAARRAAADGAPLTVGVSLVRREAAPPSETPAGVILRAPAGRGAGGGLSHA